MTTRTAVRPGIPDDDNRHYLPEYLKNTEIVVNENGNNSQPYPPLLQECTGEIVPGSTDRWYAYVPESYAADRSCPLVISLHGGLMTGWGQAVYSSWTNVADREGFIVVFPDAAARRFWTIDIAPQWVPVMTAPNPEGLYLNAPVEDPEANHDILLIRGLIDWAASAYSIDRERVFLQGMSMGEAMTSTFARKVGHLLSGAAGSGAPIDPSLLFDAEGEVVNTGGPVPLWQSRLDLDEGPHPFTDDNIALVRDNREYWLRVNGVSEKPAIAIRGVSNFAFYRGERADYVFRDVRNRDHGQTFDDAELVWDYFFSGLRRAADGRLHTGASELPRRGDDFAIAIADGCSHAWVSGQCRPLPTATFAWESAQYHGRGGARLVRGSYLYAPLGLIADVFDAQFESSSTGDCVVIRLADGRVLQFARGNVGCVVDGRVTAMLAEAVLREGELHVALEWFAAAIMDLHVSEHSGVLYVTDHHARLSGNMAVLIRDLLAGEDGSRRG